MRSMTRLTLCVILNASQHWRFKVIISFKSPVLEQLWTTGDTTLLPNSYVYQVIEILTLLNAAWSITDLEFLGGFLIDENQPNDWAVTVTVNNVEPIGSITCHFYNSNIHNIDLNEYD